MSTQHTDTGPGPWIFAIVGAESTGKSTLAEALAHALAKALAKAPPQGLAQRPGAEAVWRCTWVPEYLREWCELEGRTPAIHEQAAIAAEQGRRIDEAATRFDIVVCDTTPLMTAVYHRQVFGDRSLDAAAIAWQRHCTLTLLTALDLPWQADGLMRDGEHVREPVDAALREMLVSAGLPFSVVGGLGAARVESALDAVTPWLRRSGTAPAGLLSRLAEREATQAAWRWVCDTCDSPDCEHAALQQLKQRRSLLQGR